MATAQNTAAITFGTPTAAWATPTHFSVWRGATVLAVKAISANVPQPTIGREVSYPALAFDLIFPAGEFLAAGILDVLDYFLTRVSLTIRLHSADPGADGAGAEIVGNGYADGVVPINGWTSAA